MNEKLTPWFPAETKPVRAGVYQTMLTADVLGGYSYWNGRRWGWQTGDIDVAEYHSDPGADQDKTWRGLANPPKEQ